MGAATLISLVLTLLQSVLASAKISGLAPEVIANIEAAVANLLAVQGTPGKPLRHPKAECFAEAECSQTGSC